jgi:hypothetical protein
MDIGAGNNPCNLLPSQHDYYFTTHTEKYMEFILSDRVINCFFNALER